MSEAIISADRATVSDRARQTFHAGPLRWQWILLVGSKRISSELVDASTLTVTQDEEGAASAEIEVYSNLSGFDGAQVSIYAGYGADGMLEVFTGELGRVGYTSATGISKCTARGPTGVLSTRYYDKPVRFQGASLRAFFADLTSRLYDARARVQVAGGDEFEIEDTVFGGEVALGESATSVLEGSEYVMSDRVGYVLSVGPRPRPASGAVPAAVYNAGDYPIGQPVIEPSEEGPFAKVVVFRTDEDGQEVVRAEAPIAYRGIYPPAPNRIWWVPEFAGDQVLAQNVALYTSTTLEDDPLRGTLESIAADPSVGHHSNIWMYVDEDEPTEPDRVYRRGYAALVVEMSLDLVAATQDFTFEALRATSEDVTPAPVIPGRSPYAVMSEGAEAIWVGEDARGLFIDLEADGDWFGEDLDGLWIDPALAADEDPIPAGENATGLWVGIEEEGT